MYTVTTYYKKSPEITPDFFIKLALPTFPDRLQSSIIGAYGLHCRIRNGNGCFPTAIRTRNLYIKLNPVRNICKFYIN